MAIHRRGRARLSNIASGARRFLAKVLEALRKSKAARRGEYQAPSHFVAADVRRLISIPGFQLEPPYVGCYDYLGLAVFFSIASRPASMTP